MNYRLFVRKNTQLARCPNCGKIASLRRSRTRNLFEKFFKRLKFSPYFCQSCGWRGKIFSYRFGKNFLQLLLIYILLMIASAYIVQKFLRSYFDWFFVVKTNNCIFWITEKIGLLYRQNHVTRKRYMSKLVKKILMYFYH